MDLPLTRNEWSRFVRHGDVWLIVVGVCVLEIGVVCKFDIVKKPDCCSADFYPDCSDGAQLDRLVFLILIRSIFKPPAIHKNPLRHLANIPGLKKHQIPRENM